ncbi:formylmethanofuran dehydrogenase subunit C [Methanofollis sp. W23]|uniref:formylmethanofuran dehydrogenase subunit C n=1 Tax=Methanofollis sp. W23 TaxID=2817849 RepID=UPI001AE9FC44|nr:formylmethanofuran dehydrogenase subunit C [Methanofollis sp. W23]MBP2146491.1 formylmethanofuran dehydrogenase subunit C [Methanofollis sp. W23]
METVTLTPKEQSELYIDAENITPDTFAGKSAAEIAELQVFEGNQTQTLGQYFEVAGTAGATAEETKIVIKGDVTKVKYIGMRMTGGEIVVEGSADMYVGAWMEGGRIHVQGNVDSFSGTGMKGGEIEVDGNAGNYLGAAYRGDWRGMQAGTIRVHGDAGSDLGTFMNGGTIIVEGDVDVHVGTHAEGGTIIVKGNGTSKIGGQMVKGEIYVFGTIDVMMPGYIYREDVDLEVDGDSARFALFEGDMGERHSKRKGQVIYGKIYQKY